MQTLSLTLHQHFCYLLPTLLQTNLIALLIYVIFQSNVCATTKQNK